MKAKSVLKFYFCADGLNAALDNLILKRAFSSGAKPSKGEECARSVIELVEVKRKLGSLWSYLDKVMTGFDEADRKVLRFYGCFKGGKLSAVCRREVRRVTVRFFRHARALESFAEGLRLVEGYYCLLSLR